MRPRLQERFEALWRRLGVTRDTGPWFDSLVERYSEPQRAYHNLLHIQNCLDEFLTLQPAAPTPDVIELAIWYHDAVYDPQAHDNEERSAALAREVVAAMKLRDALADAVTDLILATRHTQAPITLPQQVIVDVDLSILGQPAEAFDAYERQIRQEYNWVPAPQFAAGRAKVLQAFLAREYIFATMSFRQRYERTARENLARSLHRLGRAG